jgi:hypothetical protein
MSQFFSPLPKYGGEELNLTMPIQDKFIYYNQYINLLWTLKWLSIRMMNALVNTMMRLTSAKPVGSKMLV